MSPGALEVQVRFVVRHDVRGFSRLRVLFSRVLESARVEEALGVRFELRRLLGLQRNSRAQDGRKRQQDRPLPHAPPPGAFDVGGGGFHDVLPPWGTVICSVTGLTPSRERVTL